jgi:GMP synthase (glutamine-hydrolysing)
MTDRVLIIDFGSQVTQLIARRIRECGVYSEIIPYNISFKKIEEFKASAIVLSGGPSSTTHEESPTISKAVFELGIPVLGICYGQQLMCDLLGGKVESSDEREFGRAYIEAVGESEFFADVWQKGSRCEVWMSHGDRVVEIPEGFKVIAKTDNAPFAAIADEQRKFYGVQFHPEVVHTPEGRKLLSNFVHKIAGCAGDWTMANFLEEEIKKVQEQVNDSKVICGVSGGVDSTVVATLLHKAIGDQLTCIFVDTGLLRKDEAKQVKEMFADYHVPLDQVDASELFLGKLDGVSDPETKRKIIGGTFIDVFEEEAKKIGGADFLAQGTLYPDVIESVSVYGNASSTIKSHHNVGGLPERMNMELVEPVRELFKDEVRALGKELGLPADMLKRHPFPGPGLAIRIPGEITKEKVEILQKADAIYLEELHESGLYDEIWQAFAVLLPVKTVGVMGDERTYEYVCALRAVTSTDGMTADFYTFDGEFLSRVSNKIINHVKGINRVVYDITSKPPGTIEWE